MGKAVIVYEQVRKNQIKTVLLIALYIIAIFMICTAIGYYYGDMVFGIGIGAFVVFILLPIQMLTGQSVMGMKTKWHEVNLNDPKEKEVLHLVEGLSIAAGLMNTPKVYILPTNVPNAFAGGLKLKDSYIGVTRGLINLLDEHEMEGVLAHEMSHIVNRDILVSTVSIYLMSAAIILGGMLWRNSRYGVRRRDSDDDKSSTVALIALAGLILSLFIKIVARLINLAISRKREYMADANAVRLCGYSDGIADALEKISGYSSDYSNSDVNSLGGEEMLCLYINNPKHWIVPLFSTHPPIEERIKLLRNMY